MSEGGDLGGASVEGVWGNPTACPGKGERLLYKTMYEITNGTEKADEKFHFYFLTKPKWVLKD